MLRNQSLPPFTMKGTDAIVSTLLTTVGQPYSPEVAGNGGLRRGQPRLKPPFPATSGLYGCPTVVNNVETIASVPFIVNGGSDWFRSMGREKSPGPKIFSLSGHIERPGQYEVPMGTTLRQLLELAGGMKGGIT